MECSVCIVISSSDVYNFYLFITNIYIHIDGLLALTDTTRMEAQGYYISNRFI